MAEIQDWRRRPLRVRYSRGDSKVPYVNDWDRNVVGVDDRHTPPDFLLRQVRGYVARPTWFDEEDAAALKLVWAASVSSTRCAAWTR